MLQKYLQKKVKQVKSEGFLTQSLKQAIKKIGSHASNRIQLESVQVACNQLISAAEKANLSQYEQQVRQLLEIVRQLLLSIHFDQIYEVQLIKIRIFLLTLALNRVNPPEKWEEEKKIMFFIQKMERSDLYLLFQEDFYSNLELLYIQATKINLKSGNPHQALKLIKQGFETLKKQIIIVSDFVNLSCSNKIGKMLQKKKNSLQILFYLEFGAKISRTYYKDDPDFNSLAEKIIQELLPKYEKLFNRIVMKFDCDQLIRKVMDSFGDKKQEQIKQKLLVSRRQKFGRFSMISSCSHISSKVASLHKINNIQNSIKFIQQLGQSRRNSLDVQMQNKLTLKLPKRMSIRCESDQVINEQDHMKVFKSRFSNLADADLGKSQGKKVRQKQLRFYNQIENMILQIRSDSNKEQQIKPQRTRIFSMVQRDEQKQREKMKTLKIGEVANQKVKISPGLMLKNGIFLTLVH